MLDHGRGDPYALIVVGAGIAGLNALFVAADYLSKEAPVLLIDQKPAPGGMWNIAYDYVRLHQPHPMFTVGNIKWSARKPPSYLPGRDEVQGHLARALELIEQRVSLRTAFGQTVVSCSEVHTSQGPLAEVMFTPSDAPGQVTTVRADRVIYASGLNYAVAKPLELSSANVVSIVPQALRDMLSRHPGADVVIVGGGKTGMDSVLATLEQDAHRRITLLTGRGTNFLNRTKYFPTGLARWTSGALVSGVFRDIARTFDGTNEQGLIAHIRRTHSTDPTSDNGVFLYGLQSEAEQAAVATGVAGTIADYLEDVIDTDAGPQIILRGGDRVAVPEGSIVVNCSGSFFREETLQQAVPLISPKGCVLGLNARHAFHFLTSVAGFFVGHLIYRDRLLGQGFYAVDLEDLFRKDRNAWVGATATQAYMNQLIGLNVLPMRVLDRCGLDMDRWYPLPRRLAALIRMKSTAAQDIDHCRRALDRVTDRFGVAAGPI